MNLKDLENKMQDAIKHLQANFDALRSSRVSKNFLDSIEIEQYGGKIALAHAAEVSILDARSLKISLFDQGLIGQAKKAIRDKLQLDAVEIGGGLKVTVPPMTVEIKSKMIARAAQEAENAKIVIRNLRRGQYDQLKKMKTDESMSEDDEKNWGKKIDTICDKYSKQIEEALKIKKETYAV